MMKETLIIRGRTYKVIVVSEYKCRFELVRPTGPMFIEGNKVYVLPDAKLEYMYTKNDIATILYLHELDMFIGIKGSKDNFILEKVNGRMYRVYEIKY